VFSEISVYIERIDDLGHNAARFGNPEAMEGSEKQVENIKTEVNSMKMLWDHIAYCQGEFESNMGTSWPSLEPGPMEEAVKKLMMTLKNMKVDKRADAYDGLMKEIKKWLVFLPLIGELRNDSMRERHWDMVRKLVNSEFAVDESLMLRDIYEMNLPQFAEDVEEVTDQARQEAKMEKTLEKLQQVWSTVNFVFTQHKDTDIYMARLGEEDFEMLEEDQTKVTAMLGSRYLSTFEDEINMWNKNLELINNVYTTFRDVQQSWAYLENLFIGSEEVKRELPKESDDFVGIDSDVKMRSKDAKKTELAMGFSTKDGYLKKVEEMQEKLLRCEKALNRFMSDKRMTFPRFFFVSDADLLEILSEGNNPEKIQPHMPKIFQAIDTLKLEPGQVRPAALGMHACVGTEYVEFTEGLKLLGKVEVYMQDVIDAMVNSLRAESGTCLKKSEAMPRTEWLKECCAQATLLANMTVYVAGVERGMHGNSLPKELTNARD
jgi:dynein heavy chain